MRKSSRRVALWLGVCLAAGGFGMARAGFDEGFAAWKVGDYQGAAAAWLPVASQGDARSQFALGLIGRARSGGRPNGRLLVRKGSAAEPC